MAYLLHIKASGKDVRGNEYPGFPFSEFIHNSVSC